MENKNLSRKKLEELKKNKEENDKKSYDTFVNGLDELYEDIFVDQYRDFYNFFIDLMDKKFYCLESNHIVYNDFVKFVDKYSNLKDDFKEGKIKEYLDDESSEEEIEEDQYDFLNKKIERF